MPVEIGPLRCPQCGGTHITRISKYEFVCLHCITLSIITDNNCFPLNLAPVRNDNSISIPGHPFPDSPNANVWELYGVTFIMERESFVVIVKASDGLEGRKRAYRVVKWFTLFCERHSYSIPPIKLLIAQSHEDESDLIFECIWKVAREFLSIDLIKYGEESAVKKCDKLDFKPAPASETMKGPTVVSRPTIMKRDGYEPPIRRDARKGVEANNNV
jgi:hypothetical protein